MNFTTTTTSKGQVTIPKAVRDKLGLKPGIRIDIFPTKDGFMGKLRKKSKILEFAGDLAHLDKGESLSLVRRKAQAAAANYRMKQWGKYAKETTKSNRA